jgi:hypothetical protein
MTRRGVAGHKKKEMTMDAFQPTHVIQHDSMTVEVMLTDGGAAYTADEWGSAGAADYERTDDGRWLFIGQAFNGTVNAIGNAHEYRIAYVAADGSWDVVRTFAATDDDAANAYAAQECEGDDDWFVLDSTGRNINGGNDQGDD